MIGNEIKTSELKSMLNRVQSMRSDLELGAVLREIEANFRGEDETKNLNALNIVHQPSDRSRSPHKFPA
jgi:hypothetical protein